MGTPGGNNNPHKHKGTNCKTDTNTGAVIFRIGSIPTLLAICEYVGEVKKQEVNMSLMVFTIARLKEITYK